jgi:phosphoglycerate dehydrogenase-like enzyme
MAPRLTILDDYQRVALAMADWSEVAARYEIEVLTEHIADTHELVQRLASSEVVVAMRERTPFGEAVLAALPALRLLVTTAMGNRSIDLEAARRLGIVVSGTEGRGSGMPEITIGMMIAVSRHFVEEDRAMRAGGWQHTVGTGLAGRTLGLVGAGRIGREVARLALAFSMEVIAWSPHLTAERAGEVGIEFATKAELFSRSDFVSIHMVLSESTRGLVGPEDLARMGSHAYLVNTSRGPLVDELALIDVLERRAIAGAALDVYDVEPLPAAHPLRSLRNTLLLPHIGYVTAENYEVFYGGVVEDILAFADGSPVRVLNAR